MSMYLPVRVAMSCRHSCICESAPRAKKSILRKLARSAVSLSHWQMYLPSMALGCTGVMSMSGLELMIIPPGCCASPLGNPCSCAPISIRSRQPGASTLLHRSGFVSISSRRSRALRDSVRFASVSRWCLGSPNAFPTSRITPLMRYVGIIAVSAAWSQPNSSKTRSMRCSRMSRGKSRSMSGVFTSASSGRNRSSGRSYSSGSMCDSPISVPTNMATDEPLPRPGGRSSTGISRVVCPSSMATSLASSMTRL